MAEHRFRPDVEILAVTDTGRRRRWTDAEKVRIVEESFGGRGLVAGTARRHDVGRSLLVRWRRQYREGLLTAEDGRMRFSPVALAAPSANSDNIASPMVHAAPAVADPPAPEQVEITLVNGRRLTVAPSIDAGALARLVQVLDQA